MKLTDLPSSYLEDMRALLGEDEYNRYCDSLYLPAVSGLRVNTLKTGVTKFAEHFDYPVKKISWIENGFFTDSEYAYSKHPYYFAGLYYLQEPSAMTPAFVLGTKPGEHVLDLCAAPGGKSTQIGCDLMGSGVLVSNDISNSRSKALLKNIELFGIDNTYLTCENSANLAVIFPEYFDRILIDAPCSGQGMFRKKPSVIQAYIEHGSDFYCDVQMQLISDAALMLCDGGTMVYSTCTYNPHEDEDIITAFLKLHHEFEVDPIELKDGFSESKILGGCIRLYPHCIQGEGHFVCRLKKNGTTIRNNYNLHTSPRSGHRSFLKAERLAKKDPALTELLSHIDREYDEARFFFKDNYIYYLPKEPDIINGVRYTRTGLLFAQIKGKILKPSQALAMSLDMNSWDNPINYSCNDQRIIRYLKGETLESDEDYDGYRLVCTDGFPLGFVKQKGKQLKNQYLPGWRLL